MADLSPELAARIAALEASYADNPGRYFVALAGAWREGGDIARAEEILRENLKRFPGLSAHVLLGRCLADRGAFQEAANEFHYVLSIDSQNLIALRTLAEMAAAGGRRVEAEKWYNELLAVDPMNVEARAALTQLARVPSAPAPAAPASGTDGDEFGMIDLGAPDASPADASGVAAAADADVGEWGDLALDAAPAPAEAQPAGDAREFDAFGFGSVDLDGSDADAADAADSVEWVDADARQDVGESAAADEGDDLPLLDDTLIDAPLAGADLPLLDTGAADDNLVSAVSEPGAGFGFGEPTPSATPFDDGGPVAHEHDGHDVDAEVVTETMAELYASQGLLAQAADVYRELIGQRGGEPGLVRRLAEIEAQIQPAPWAEAAAAAAEPTPADEAPDWLESVDAFARGGAATPLPDAGLDRGLPELELNPGLADEERLHATGLDAEPSAAADELGLIEPPVIGDDAYVPPAWAQGGASAGTEIDDLASVEPAPVDDFASIPVPADAGFHAGESAPAPELEPATASADPFADSFAGGFDGIAAEPAGGGAEAEDGRQAWEAPTVAETEPVGFDILVVEDEEGAEIPAPADVVADVSADWAIAAAPLEDDEEAAEAELAATSAAATTFTAPPPPPEVAHTGTPGRTMSGYFASLLAWRPAPPAAEAAPTYEVSAEGGSITIEPAAPEAPPAEETPSAAPYAAETPDEPWAAPAPSTDLAAEAPAAAAEAEGPIHPSEPPPFAAAPEIPAFDAPSFQPPAPAFGGLEPEAPAADDEPWAAAPPAEDEPWAAPTPETSAAAEGGDLPLLDLEEPWAESPAAPRAEPVDIGAFTLAEDEAPAPAEPAQPAAAEDADAEELLPWEVPAEPAAAAPEAPAGDAGGFSFEDFFSGTSAPAPSAPAPSAPAPAPAPEPVAPPPVVEEPAAPAFIPSFAEPTPPPVFEAPAPVTPPAPPPAPAAPVAAEQDEDDEDLESFQAWLQSLKR